jgi:zinc transporter, ZIP family
VSGWAAFGWGAFSSAALFIGQWLAGPTRDDHRATGEVMGFGAGTLIGAIAYELIPESTLGHGFGVGIPFLIGAVVYVMADWAIDERGGSERRSIDRPKKAGSGAAMFIGTLLDGIPEALVLGITLANGGSVSVAFVTAVFVSNIPQGLAGTTSLRASGTPDRTIGFMWAALTLACAVVAALGYQLGHTLHAQGHHAQAFAAGAVLAMLASSMMPEAFEHGGRRVGLYTVFGYVAAGLLTIAG